MKKFICIENNSTTKIYKSSPRLVLPNDKRLSKPKQTSSLHFRAFKKMYNINSYCSNTTNVCADRHDFPQKKSEFNLSLTRGMHNHNIYR